MDQVVEWDKEAEKYGRAQTEEARENLKDIHNQLEFFANAGVEALVEIRARIMASKYHPLGTGRT